MATAKQFGLFVPTTQIWDVSSLYSTDINSVAFKELMVRLYQQVNLIATVLNLKDSGYYDTQEFVNGQLYFPNPNLNSTTSTNAEYRQVLRLVINFGALPNTGTKSVAHKIVVNSSTTFTRIYGAASDTTGFHYIPLPYASPTAANNIELKVDATNVTVITGSNRTNFNITYIVLEYLQS